MVEIDELLLLFFFALPGISDEILTWDSFDSLIDFELLQDPSESDVSITELFKLPLHNEEEFTSLEIIGEASFLTA